MKPMWAINNKNIGFVSTRIAGNDGVTLELKKWVEVLERNTFNCYFFAGKLDTQENRSFLAEEAYFKHEKIEKIHKNSFGHKKRSPEITKLIYEINNSKVEIDLRIIICDVSDGRYLLSDVSSAK